MAIDFIKGRIHRFRSLYEVISLITRLLLLSASVIVFSANNFAAEDVRAIAQVSNCYQDKVREVLELIGGESALSKRANDVNAQFLKNAIAENSDYDLFKTVQALSTDSRTALELQAHFPREHYLRKVIDAKKLSDTEREVIMEKLLTFPDLPLVDTSSKMNRYLQREVFKPYLKKQLKISDENALQNALNLLSKPSMDYEHAVDIVGSFKIKRSIQQEQYKQILNTFDLLDIARMGQKESAAEPLTMEIMKKGAADFAVAEKELSKVNHPTIRNYFSAMKVVTGKNPEFRELEVAMGPNNKTRSYYIETSKEAADALSKNGLLTTKVLVSEKDPNLARVYVEYPSAMHCEHLKPLFSPALLEALSKMGADPSDALVTRMNHAVIRELTEALFHPKKRLDLLAIMEGYPPSEFFRKNHEPTPVELYQAMVSVHPLEDGNGRLSRLFFEFSDPHHYKMASPVMDTDLFQGRLLANFLEIHPAISTWIAEAKNDKEFVKRSETALRILLKKNPELVTMFPEVKNL